MKHNEVNATRIQSNGKRTDPRTAFITQAFVSIPPLSTQAYQVNEISRGGMFLAFKGASTTLSEMEYAGIDRGAPVEIAFAVSLNGKQQRIRVRAKIARITKRGIGVEFVTHNPPQISGLRELFSAEADTTYEHHEQKDTRTRLDPSQVFRQLAQSSDWKEWEIEEY